MAKSKKILVRYCGKGGDVFTIQRVRRPDPCIDEVALVQFQTHLAGDMLLCGGDKGTQSFAQRAEPLAIIHQLKVMASSRFLWAVSLSSVRVSNTSWALYRMVPPGVS